MAGGELSDSSSYLEGRPCPKCAYVRAAADTSPASQCPRCGIIYQKYRAPSPELIARIAERRRALAGTVVDERSMWSLIGANLLGAAIALLTNMTLRDLMLAYWLQSVIIGVSYLVRMLKSHELELFTPMCFVINYGLFHAFYFHFLAFGTPLDGVPSGVALAGLLLCGLVFAGHEVYSTTRKIARDRLAQPSLGDLAGASMARIVPMHITIVLPGALGFSAISWLLFVGLKTVVDVTMHAFEQQLAHRSARKTTRDGA